MNVVVAALTFRRPADLAALVPELVRQAEGATDDVEVLIVDNDPDASARDLVGSFGSPVVYRHAPKPGIAAARNVALDAAVEADLLVFIDDDERPADGWLDLLLATWRATEPAAVVGPVVSAFDVEPDPWVRAGRFFDRRRLPTGSETAVAATNNLLIDLHFIRAAGLRFDERFGLTGGEDTMFTRSIHAAGGRLVWCDEAVVTDVVPASRITREWVLNRAYSSGNSDAITSIALARTARERGPLRVRLAARGALRIGAGGVRVLVGALLRDTGQRARGTRTMARGRGMLAGVAGNAFVEYRRD